MSENQKYLVLIASNIRDVEQLEEISSELMATGCDGVEEFAIDEARVDEILGERAYSGGDIPESVIDEVSTTVIDNALTHKYFFYQGDIKSNVDKAKKYLENLSNTIVIEVIEKEFEDWNTQWRSTYKGQEISKRMKIIPEWEKKDQVTDEGIIYIYPGMGFGTGEHETTFLCLKLYDQFLDNKSIKNCLDFGCGSGILGIASILYSDSSVDFCDIDVDALNNCVQNMTLNFDGQDLSKHRLISRERFKLELKYDLVFANILEYVLIEEYNTLKDSVATGGDLIVSGILNHQVENIKNKFVDFKTINVESKNDWSAILFERV